MRSLGLVLISCVSFCSAYATDIQPDPRIAIRDHFVELYFAAVVSAEVRLSDSPPDYEPLLVPFILRVVADITNKGCDVHFFDSELLLDLREQKVGDRGEHGMATVGIGRVSTPDKLGSICPAYTNPITGGHSRRVTVEIELYCLRKEQSFQFNARNGTQPTLHLKCPKNSLRQTGVPTILNFEKFKALFEYRGMIEEHDPEVGKEEHGKGSFAF